MMHYHGTPITPRKELYELGGRNFCVSYAAPEQVGHVHRIGQSVMLDNGAFSVWRRGLVPDWEGWQAWALEWLDCPTTWAVLPDSIEGGERENDELLDAWPVPKGVPVWHLHESLERLERLVERFGKVCFGSSGNYAQVGSTGWHDRVTRAFDTIADEAGRVPWVHMLRGMSMCGERYPFASVDSTDVARNHHLPRHSAVRIAERWDSLQCPHRWVLHRQMELTA